MQNKFTIEVPKLALYYKPHPYRKWDKDEITITRQHAKAIIDKVSNFYRSTNYLVANNLSYRSFASISNRLQKDVNFLKRNQLTLFITDHPSEEVMKTLRKKTNE